MKRGKANQAKIVRETGDLTAMLLMLPDNPVNWLRVVLLVAPIVARLAVRMALKRLDKSLSEDKVNAIGTQVGALIKNIIDAKKGDKVPKGTK